GRKCLQLFTSRRPHRRIGETKARTGNNGGGRGAGAQPRDKARNAIAKPWWQDSRQQFRQLQGQRVSVLGSYRLRLRRQHLLGRSFLQRRELKPVANRMGGVRPDPMLLFTCLRNEKVRLPYFLQYYRD